MQSIFELPRVRIEPTDDPCCTMRHGIHYLALPGMLEANLGGGEAMQIDAMLHTWIVRLPANRAGQALPRHTNNEGQSLQCVKGWRCRCTHVTTTTGTETD